MTTLNQAFIKAYQRRGIAAPHMPLPRATVSQEDKAQSPPPIAPSGQVLAFDDSDAAIPAAHVYRKARLSPSMEPPAVDDRPSLEAALAAPSISSSAAPAPLTVLEAIDDHAADLDAAAVDDLRPAYEVDHFDWPAIVDTLLEQEETEISPLLAELLPTGRGTLLVTGCRRGEGRTSVALLLARYIAKAGSRVLLIDADFGRPGIAHQLGTEVEVGWEAALAGASPSETMIESVAERLVILPLRQTVDESVVRALPSGWQATRDRWQHEFDVICVDMGPLIESPDSRHEMWVGDAPVEAAIVVRDVRHCRLEQSHAVGRKLVELAVSRWAIIENFV
ncbi:MAG: cellulose synthase operon protein YhjQ/BcsQ [Pirellulales bacterium]